MNLPVSSDTQFSILLESLGKNKNYKENILIKKFHFINRHKLQKSNINLFCINVKVNKYIKQRILLNNANANTKKTIRKALSVCWEILSTLTLSRQNVRSLMNAFGIIDFASKNH